MTPTTYRGYHITPIFNYTNGRTDGYYWKLSEGEESIQPFFGSTLEEIKGEIDSLKPTNIYILQNYNFSTDMLVVEATEIPLRNNYRLFSIHKMDIKDFKFSQIK